MCGQWLSAKEINPALGAGRVGCVSFDLTFITTLSDNRSTTMSEAEKNSGNSVVLNIIIGIAAVSGIIWLVMNCPSCH